MTEPAAPSRIASLPTGMPAPTRDAREERLSEEFTLPAGVTTTLSWRSFRMADGSPAPESWLTFRMSELTPQDQADALRLARDGGNSVVTMELVFKVVVSLGGEPTRGRRDMMEQWWKALGPKGRKLVETSFMDLSAPTEEEVATFRASRKP